jgi:hypothetical protein
MKRHIYQAYLDQIEIKYLLYNTNIKTYVVEVTKHFKIMGKKRIGLKHQISQHDLHYYTSNFIKPWGQDLKPLQMPNLRSKCPS